MSAEALAVIVGMAVVTYATRAGGYQLLSSKPLSPRLAAWLQTLPGPILVATVAPMALGRGPAEVIAALVSIWIAVRTKNLVLTVLAGAAVAALLRAAAIF